MPSLMLTFKDKAGKPYSVEMGGNDPVHAEKIIANQFPGYTDFKAVPMEQLPLDKVVVVINPASKLNLGATEHPENPESSGG